MHFLSIGNLVPNVQQLDPQTSPSKMQLKILAKFTIRGSILYRCSPHHFHTYKHISNLPPMPSPTVVDSNPQWERQAHSHDHPGGVDSSDFSDGGPLVGHTSDGALRG